MEWLVKLDLATNGNIIIQAISKCNTDQTPINLVTLVDHYSIKKKLVGINTFTTDGENLNFAVSVNDLVDFLNSPEKKLRRINILKKEKRTYLITKKQRG